METFKLKGTIIFDPENKTSKHSKQSSWKRIAMLMFKNEPNGVLEYYAWFLKKRYNIILNKPLRGPHVSFINDRVDDLKSHASWEEVKKKYHGTKIEVEFSVDVRTDSKHWWLIVTEEYRTELQNIRNELGLDRPFFGMHMSLGFAIDGRVEIDDFIEEVEKAGRMNLEQSKYIHGLIKKGLL